MNTPMFAYFAEPIDQHSDKPVPGATEVNSALQYAGFNVYRPRTAFRCYGGVDPRIEQINRAALYQADIVIACLPTGYPSIGVPAEIEAATSRGIPALVYHDGQSMALAGNPLVTTVDTTVGIGSQALEIVRARPARQENHQLGLVVRAGWATPSRVFADDAGVDLECSEQTVLPAHAFTDIPTAVEGTQLPDGYWGMITGRSSTIRRRGVLVPTGVIDQGWRGGLWVGAWNLTDQDITVKPGERLGQIILVPMTNPAHGSALPPPVASIDRVPDHARGTNGFGSSGA